MEVNFFGTVHLTKTFLELIRENKGRVINVSSLNGLVGLGSFSVYASSKYAIEGFSDSLRKEMAPLGVAVSIINPGIVATKIHAKDLLQTHDETNSEEKWLKLYPQYLIGIKEKLIAGVAHAATTDVTTSAIIKAALDPRPSARYFVAGGDGVPASIGAILARILPAYLLDRLSESFHD